MTLPLLVGRRGRAWSARPRTSAGRATKAMIEAYERGDVAEALRLHRQLLPIFTGIFRTQGTILVKAGLRAARASTSARSGCRWSTRPSTRSSHLRAGSGRRRRLTG